MGFCDCLIGLFTILAYAYSMWVLPLAAAGFLFNLGHKYPSLSAYFPYNIDAENSGVNSGANIDEAVHNNVYYLAVWAGAHSLAARPAFKKIFLKVFPQSFERPFYIFQSAYLLHQVLEKWVPIDEHFCSVPECFVGFTDCIFIFGYLFLLSSTFAIDHFELFGLRQGLKMGNFLRFVPDGFVTQAHYKYVRHPIMTGFFIIFWACPTMTLGHVLFSTVASTYIILAVHFLEEPDLVEMMGKDYVEYMEKTPAYCPFFGKSKEKSN